MMLYLRAPKAGGFTTFPQLGITVPPVQVLIILMTTTIMVIMTCGHQYDHDDCDHIDDHEHHNDN